ncbi:winged helix-turn-helix transcriptional regulator [Nocardia transvalensis]|uniref:winged helix-turn-helix transcriptional regulator n=1 Tax=Nocardia transvalensis TaxID=37333 RepID=UPI001893B017|nr:winged helix-turn-helix transcriptional regulator [Nocardia transvalensis]MBF6330726.1 transcriptional regulator [Nocardia transvalensis]
MPRRTYDQFCGLALALDIVGERWTLLIVRELMSGPKRYSDLAAALDGIGTSLLASRVKQLEFDGIIARRHLRPPIASTVYELTAVGRELARAMIPLALWGSRHYTEGGRAPTQRFRAEWALVFLAQLFDPDALRGIDAYYEFHADGSVAHLHIHDGRADVYSGPGDHPPDATFTYDSGTLAAIIAGTLSVPDALAQQRIEASGNPEAIGQLLTPLLAALETIAPKPSSSEQRRE